MQNTSAGERIRVAVIDDDVALRDLLVECLTRRGFLAKGLANPAHAEDDVALFGAHIVLCDICMPGVDGLQVTRQLKNRDAGMQIILMTGFPAQETVDEAFALGVSGYLLKPFASLDNVFAEVDKAAGNLKRWEEDMREAVRREFPEEYSILYAGPDGLPPPQDLEKLIAEVEEAASDTTWRGRTE